MLLQGPLSQLQPRKIAQHIQSKLVPWIVSKYGALYKKECSSPTVRNMIIAIIEGDDLAGLGSNIKTLAGRYKMAFDALAKKAWKTSIRAINNHRAAVRDAVMEVIVNPRTVADILANQIAERVFGVRTMGPIVSLEDARFQALVASSPNPAQACIWETQSSHGAGFRSVLSSSLKTAGATELLDYLGICLSLTSAYLSISQYVDLFRVYP